MSNVSSYDARQTYRDPEFAAAYDHDRFAARRRKRTRDARTQRALLAALGRLVDVGHVLDLPCGTGRITSLLVDAGFRYTGVDLSGAMLALARGKTGGDARAVFVQAEGERLPLADAAVDCVVCVRFLHLVPPAVRLGILREMARVSRRYLVIDFRHFRHREIWQRLFGWWPKVAERRRQGAALRSELAQSAWQEAFRVQYKSRGLLSSTRMIGVYTKRGD